MNIQGVSQLLNTHSEQNPAPPVPVNTPVAPAPVSEQEAAGVYQPGVQPPPPPAQNPGYADRARMAELWNEHHRQVDAFRRMMEALFERQAREHNIAWGTWNPQEVPVTDEMRAAAQAQIDEGGYFSVEATAQRILDFAFAISGGDASRIDVLRGAIEQAFENAERIWGGELPQISRDTHAAIMEGLDYWASGGDPRNMEFSTPASTNA